MFGQAFAGHAAERFQIARLRFDEVAGQRQLAIDHLQAGFELGAFVRQGACGVGKTVGLAPAVAHGDEVQHRQQHQRHRPLHGPVDPLRGRGARQHLRAVDPDEEAGPAKGGKRGENRHDPAQARADRFVLPVLLGNRFLCCWFVGLGQGFTFGKCFFVLRSREQAAAGHPACLPQGKCLETPADCRLSTVTRRPVFRRLRPAGRLAAGQCLPRQAGMNKVRA